MLDWVSENSGFVSASTGLVTAAIWLVYLQLFYLVYRGQRRAMIVITRALGTGSGGHCLVSNMSASPVHILSILAVLEADGESRVCTITDDEDLSEGRATVEHTYQGPLASGAYMDLGPFDAMVRRNRAVERPAAGGEDGEEPFTSIEILVIALYGSSRRFIGASRCFAPTGGETPELRPTSLETAQLAGFRQRRRMRRLLRENL